MSTPPAIEGIIAREEQAATDAIRAALAAIDIDPGNRPIDLRALPFEGTWGSASTISRMFAGDLANKQLAASGELEGLSKKEAKQLVNQLVGPKAQELAEHIANHVTATGRFARVEAVNGYVNFTYDANGVAARLMEQVFSQGDRYGWAARDTHTETVMVEHSQLNTHKAAHVGHLRNICLGVAVTNITEAAGYRTMPVNYIGDMGLHVIRCLWCYQNFHNGEEPQGDVSRGRWLGDIYAEASSRLSFRKDVLEFLNALIQEDLVFATAVDRTLRNLWRTNMVDGEDIAYLLGRISGQQPIDLAELRDESAITHLWPFIGEQLQLQIDQTDGEEIEIDESVDLESAEPSVPVMTVSERLEAWQHFTEHMADWWPHGPAWNQEIKDMFQQWERKDPEFVALWEKTRDWSMADLYRIFEEFGAHFDHYFWESQVEEPGRVIVRELLERGIAEISDGLPVVKIDEKLGLTTETYRTMPILRSDGTTLYQTKDLALTREKFQNYDIDRAIWVVDVRQSLYFDQIFKILEIAGFEQADECIHLGYEFVALPGGAISSRKGNAPMLEDVRDAMLERAQAVIREKNPTLAPEAQDQVARQVAIGAIKYVMLARDSNKVIVFDPEEALSFEGHAAPYIQYAHARACRILENGGVTDADILAKLTELNFGETQPEELALLSAIADFPAMVTRAAEELRPLHITNYVFDVAKRFNDFYHACPVLISEEPVRTARLTLVAATRTTLKNGLALLGIEAPEVM